MDNNLFVNFLKAAREDRRVCYDSDYSFPYKEILDQIYNDVSNFKYYTFDGRFDDILIKLTKNTKYETEGYKSFLRDIEEEMKFFIVTNIIMLPINFLDSKIIKKDQELCDNIKIFLPTKEDLAEYKGVKVIKKGSFYTIERKNDKSPICKYYRKIIGCKLNKGHIRISKDCNFFNYPIMTIKIDNIDSRVEGESGKITEAIYCFIRILDFLEEKEYRSFGYFFNRERKNPAHTFVVDYNDYMMREKDIAYGHSFRFNCSNILDVDTDVFLSKKIQLGSLINLYLNFCFLNLRNLKKEDIKQINRWKNSIKLFNTAFEFASTEKYDACVLILCSLLESLFLKNEGRNKKERLVQAVKKFRKGVGYSENIEDAVESLYKYRNDFIHEGQGYENKFLHTRGLHDYQGECVGMRPFTYFGACAPNKDLYKIKAVMKFLAELVIHYDFISRIEKE